MQFDLCRHIRTNGVQCQSPALSLKPYCFFHTRMAERHSGFRHTAETHGYLIPGQHIQLAPLEDRESIQVALSVVVNALATGQLETRRATAILYGLQLASMNAVRLNLSPFAPDIVRTAEQTLDGQELAEPGATGHILTAQEIKQEQQEQDENEEEEDQDEADQDEANQNEADQDEERSRDEVG